MSQMPVGLDMWSVQALLLLLCCSGYWCNNCNNKTRLYFVSRNFYSVLHWDEVDVPGQEVLYSVVYTQYGKSYMPMMECQNISATFCDLSSVITEASSAYFTRVMVNETCFGEYERFKLSEQTILGEPEVSTITAESSLTVTVTPPLGPRNQSIKEIIRGASGVCHINYEVHLTHPKSKTAQDTSGMVTLSSLEENTEYCGTAFYLWTHPSILKKSEVATFCVTLPAQSGRDRNRSEQNEKSTEMEDQAQSGREGNEEGDKESEQNESRTEIEQEQAKSWIHVFIVPGLVALFLLLTLALVMCQLYVMRKRRLPEVLKQTVPKSSTLPYYLDHKVEISNVSIYSESPWKADRPKAYICHVVEELNMAERKRGHYAPQDLPGQCNSYANQQVENYDQSNNSTTSYSMVMTDPVPESPKSSDSGMGDTISSQVTTPLFTGRDIDHFQDLHNESVHELSEMDTDTNSEVLVLPVSRDANGKLAFLPELPRSSGLLTHSSGLTPTGERTPFLTDVITIDEKEELPSDYGRTYLRHYVQQNSLVLPSTDTVPVESLSDCTSSYRQNWVPGIPLKSHLNNSDCIMKMEQLTEPEIEDEEEETLSSLGTIVLDRRIGFSHPRIAFFS